MLKSWVKSCVEKLKGIGWKNLLNFGGTIGKKALLKKIVKQICGKIVWKVLWKSWLGKLYGKKRTVYSVQCTMYSKVVILSLLREPHCSSVWGVELFSRLLLCLTPSEDLNKKLSGTSKWSEIWLSGTRKWIEIWLLGTPKWSEIWLSEIPKWSEISILK